MSFWRKIAGLAVRNLDEAECDQCPPGLPGEDPAFSTAVTGLTATTSNIFGTGTLTNAAGSTLTLQTGSIAIQAYIVGDYLSRVAQLAGL